MRKKRLGKKDLSWLKNLIFPVLMFTTVFLIITLSLKNTSASVDSEGIRNAEEAIRRAAICCYAIEGSYPESYSYLRDNYGLSVNEDRYTIHYSIFASNIMPEITVLARGGAK